MRSLSHSTNPSLLMWVWEWVWGADQICSSHQFSWGQMSCWRLVSVLLRWPTELVASLGFM